VSGIEIFSSQGLKKLAHGMKTFPPKGLGRQAFSSKGLILRVFSTRGMKKFLYLTPTALSENLFQFESVYRHSSISAVLISAIFNLPRFKILSYFPPLYYY
jgi:hypothetical protein